MDQPKIEHLLRLLRLLAGNRNYTIEELAEKLDMSYRTIYRYNSLINPPQKTTPRCHKKPHRDWRMMRKIRIFATK